MRNPLDIAARIARNPAAWHPAPEIANALEAMVKGPLGYIVRLDTRHFSFEAHGVSEEQANEAMGRALNTHAEQYGLDANWWEEFAEEFKTTPFRPGATWRDNEVIGPR